jgi:hypothetical protein
VPLVHADLKRVDIQEHVAKAAPSAMVAAALAAYPGTAIKFTDPVSPSASAEITVNTESQEKRAVYVDPYTGHVLGSLPDRGTIMWTIRHLHSLKYFGSFTRALIEIAGGWAILLVGTGIYLWWPRRQTGGVVTVRGTPKRRVFWRDMHAVTAAHNLLSAMVDNHLHQGNALGIDQHNITWRRVLDVLDMEPDVADPAEAGQALPEGPLGVEFTGVGFDDTFLAVPPGSRPAISCPPSSSS